MVLFLLLLLLNCFLVWETKDLLAVVSCLRMEYSYAKTSQFDLPAVTCCFISHVMNNVNLSLRSDELLLIVNVCFQILSSGRRNLQNDVFLVRLMDQLFVQEPLFLRHEQRICLSLIDLMRALSSEEYREDLRSGRWFRDPMHVSEHREQLLVHILSLAAIVTQQPELGALHDFLAWSLELGTSCIVMSCFNVICSMYSGTCMERVS